MAKAQKIKETLSPSTTTTMRRIAISPEFGSLVDGAMEEIDALSDNLATITQDPAVAKAKVQEIYLRNLERYQTPVVAAMSLLAELKTRIDIDRKINPGKELVDEKYLRLLEEMRKTVELVHKTTPKITTVRSVASNDNDQKFAGFIDIQNEE